MAEHARQQTDFVPHLPDLLISMGQCWRSIRDSQTEADPFGRSYAALDEARAALEALAYQFTGQHGFFALADGPMPSRGDLVRPGEPF